MSNVVDMRRQMKLRLVEDCQRLTDGWREDLKRKDEEHELQMALDMATEELRFAATKLRSLAGKHLAAQRTRAVYQDVFGE
jgi:hypothetical protein